MSARFGLQCGFRWLQCVLQPSVYSDGYRNGRREYYHRDVGIISQPGFLHTSYCLHLYPYSV